MDIKLKDIGVSIKNKTLLQSVSVNINPGELLTIMGPSGAGKTTLLNVLSGRCLYSGSLTINNQDFNKQLKRKIAYVQQKDVFFPNLKLKETLMYNAHLQMASEMSNELKEKRVNEIMEKLELQKCSDTVMGDDNTSGFGLSGGEKKRANIACKLMSNPVILLIDEPTSGLDSHIAYSLMTTINCYARDTGKIVVVSIHQPSSRIFQLFHQLLVLVDGNVAYSGKADRVKGYFKTLGMTSSIDYNPADFILDVVKQDKDTVNKIVNHAKKYQENIPSNERVEQQSLKIVNDRNKNMNELGLASNNINMENEISSPKYIFDTDQDMENYIDRDMKWPTPFWNQFTTLTARQFKQSIPRLYTKTKVLSLIIYTAIAGIFWFQKKPTEENVQYLHGFFFFANIECSFILAVEGVFAFIRFKAVTRNEREEGMYRLTAYYLSVMIVDTFIDCSYCVLFYMISYWLVGLTATAWVYLASVAIFILEILLSHSVGILTGILFSQLDIAMTSAVLILVCNVAASDFLVRNLPPAVSWSQHIAFFKYSMTASLKLELLYGPPRECSPVNTTTFLQCRSDFTNATVDGSLILESMCLNSPLWSDFLFLILLLFILRSIAYIALKCVEKHNRVI